VSDGDDQVLNLALDNSRFPLFVQGKTIKITSIELAADTSVVTASLQVVAPGAAAGTSDPLNLAAGGVYGKWLNGSVDYSAAPKDPGLFVIKNPAGGVRLKDTDWKNVVIIVRYTVS